MKLENYESVQLSGIKKGSKISFHRHCKDRCNFAILQLE